jgi:hypothetical protein
VKATANSLRCAHGRAFTVESPNIAVRSATDPARRSLQGPPRGTSAVNAEGEFGKKGKPGHLAKAFPVPPFQIAVSLSSSRDFSDQPKPRAWQISGDLKAHRNKLAALLKSHRADPNQPLPDPSAEFHCPRVEARQRQGAGVGVDRLVSAAGPCRSPRCLRDRSCASLCEGAPRRPPTQPRFRRGFFLSVVPDLKPY